MCWGLGVVSTYAAPNLMDAQYKEGCQQGSYVLNFTTEISTHHIVIFISYLLSVCPSVLHFPLTVFLLGLSLSNTPIANVVILLRINFTPAACASHIFVRYPPILCLVSIQTTCAYTVVTVCATRVMTESLSCRLPSRIRETDNRKSIIGIVLSATQYQ